MNPSSLPQLPRAIAGALEGGARFGVGRVVQHSPQGLRVSPGGLDTEPVLAGWQRGVYQPTLGETVGLVEQYGTWFCVGPIAGPLDTPNAVTNYSFEDSAAGEFPVGWTLVNTAGSSTLDTFEWKHPEFIDGGKVGRLTASGTATMTCQVVSNAIPVEAKQTWGVGAWYRPNAGFGVNAGTIRIYTSWYSGSNLSSLISEESAVTFPLVRGHGWRLITENGQTGRGPAAPNGANYLRVKVALSWSAISGDVVYLDRITARRTS
jgi:hypothetical protein